MAVNVKLRSYFELTKDIPKLSLMGEFCDVYHEYIGRTLFAIARLHCSSSTKCGESSTLMQKMRQVMETAQNQTLYSGFISTNLTTTKIKYSSEKGKIVAVILNVSFSNTFQWLVLWAFTVIGYSVECCWTLFISQQQFCKSKISQMNKCWLQVRFIYFHTVHNDTDYYRNTIKITWSRRQI